MKKLLGIIAVGAIAFGAVSTAATSLTFSGNAYAPAQGSVTVSGLCSGSSGDVSWTYTNGGTAPQDATDTVNAVKIPVACTGTPTGWFVDAGSSITVGSVSYSAGLLTVPFTGGVAIDDIGTANYADSISVTAY